MWFTTVAVKLYVVGTTNIKAKVLKDGHLFIIHIVDPQLEMGEEVSLPGSETELEWQISEETVPEQTSGMCPSLVVATQF